MDNFKFRQHVVIVFEYLYLNLYTYMKDNKRKREIFHPQQLKVITYQMLQGLKYMKNKQVIHCDMKPENVLFTDDSVNSVKLIDFGASCESCQSGFFYVQSRYYRAPEILLGNPYDHAVDMWSLGCIIYELIVGSPLFPAKDENELLEYFIVTIGRMPAHMLTNAKKYKQFYKKSSSFLSTYGHEVIRANQSCFGNSLKEKSQPLQQLLKNYANWDQIDFIEKCLKLDPAERIKPSEGLLHQWFSDIALPS